MIDSPPQRTPIMGTGHSIRFGNYRYTEWRPKPAQPATAAVLTNLAADPGEVFQRHRITRTFRRLDAGAKSTRTTNQSRTSESAGALIPPERIFDSFDTASKFPQMTDGRKDITIAEMQPTGDPYQILDSPKSTR